MKKCYPTKVVRLKTSAPQVYFFIKRVLRFSRFPLGAVVLVIEDYTHFWSKSDFPYSYLPSLNSLVFTLTLLLRFSFADISLAYS